MIPKIPVSSIEEPNDQLVASLTKSLADKENSICGLLLEGEKLAKEILKANNLLKTRKFKETELSKELQSLKEQLIKTSQDNCQVNLTLIAVQEDNKSFQSKLTDVHKKNDILHAKCSRLEKNETSLTDQIAGLGITSNEASSVALQVELKKNLKLADDYKTMQNDAKTRENSFAKEIESLKLSLLNCEDDMEYRQTKHKKDIEIIQSRLEAAESRNEELSISSHETSKPLIKQLESMRLNQNLASKNWEEYENQANIRCSNLERERIFAQEECVSLRVKSIELLNRITTLEFQASLERQDRLKLDEQLNREKEALAALSVNYNQLVNSSDAVENRQVVLIQKSKVIRPLRKDEMDKVVAALADSKKIELSLRRQLAAIPAAVDLDTEVVDVYYFINN